MNKYYLEDTLLMVDRINTIIIQLDKERTELLKACMRIEEILNPELEPRLVIFRLKEYRKEVEAAIRLVAPELEGPWKDPE